MTALHASSPATAPAPASTDATALASTTVLEQRLTELEIKASFADDLLDTLNRLVAQQQETIDLLVREVSRLRQQGSAEASPGQRDPREDLPPHY